MIDKNKIFEEIKNQQEEVIKDFEKMLEQFKGVTDLDEESTREVDDFAQQSTSEDIENRIGIQFESAKGLLNILNDLDLSPKTDVCPGAVVITNKAKFFVSIPNSSIEVDGTTFIGISTDAPLYYFMKGKKKGDSFKYGKTSYEIKDLY
jgi:hypothetical protein